jgi:hypothetical protein
MPLTVTQWKSIFLKKSVIVNLIKKVSTFNGTPRFNTLKMIIETVGTSETSVSFHQTTRRNIPEDSRLRTLRRENLKAHV